MTDKLFERLLNMCQAAVDCEGNNGAGGGDCVSNSANTSVNAKLYGCFAEFDSYAACAEAASTCTDLTYGPEGDACASEKTKADECLFLAASGDRRRVVKSCETVNKAVSDLECVDSGDGPQFDCEVYYDEVVPDLRLMDYFRCLRQATWCTGGESPAQDYTGWEGCYRAYRI